MADESRKTNNPADVPPEQDQREENTSTRRSRKKPELNPLEVKLTVGQLISRKRRELGWSQEELAWNSEVSRSEVGRVERDECDPKVKTIEGLESALGMELYDLFMTQRRERARSSQNQKAPSIPTGRLGKFGRELVKKGISPEEMDQVLDEALLSAESKSKKKK